MSQLGRLTRQATTETRKGKTMFGVDAEHYANQRIADLTKAIAGCLTPDTLDAVGSDITDNATRPVLADLATFGKRLLAQREVLIG